MSEEEICVLLLEPETKAQIGLIRFDPSGMLIFQLIKPGLHVYALRPIHDLLANQWLRVPLYRKHARLLDNNKNLPEDVLMQEANDCASFLNNLETPPKLGENRVIAKAIHARSAA